MKLVFNTIHITKVTQSFFTDFTNRPVSTLRGSTPYLSCDNKEWSARWRVCFTASKTVYMYMVITNRITGVEYPDLHLNGTKITKVL